MYILPNILISKGSQTIKFVNRILNMKNRIFNMKNSFLEKSLKNVVEGN